MLSGVWLLRNKKNPPYNIVVTIHHYGNYPLYRGWKSRSTRLAESLSRKNSMHPQDFNSVLNEYQERICAGKAADDLKVF